MVTRRQGELIGFVHVDTILPAYNSEGIKSVL